MDDNVALPEHEIKYEVGPAGDVETKRESAPKAIARRSPVAIALGLLIVALLGYATYRIMWPQTQGRRPPGRGSIGGAQPVGVATVARGDIKIVRNGLGAVTPIANVIVKTQLNGYLTEVAFQEGQMVQKGDFLAQIDPRPYQVLKEQYEGQLRHDQGFLDQARADLKRYNTLMKQDSIARQQAENQVWVVKQYEGSVKSDQAQVDNQTLNLTYAHIIAPVSGRVGLRQVDAGNYVTTGDANGIVLLTQIDPISVIFSLPEDYLPEIIAGQKAHGVLQATALDRANSSTLGVGRLNTLDNSIDTTTGMVRARAEFDNKDEKLYPNQFVNVQLLVDVEKNVITMPAAAVQTGANGSFVYLVKEGAKVAVQPVAIGVADGGMVEVKSGVGEGDQVVIDGADRLRDGAEIKIADNKPTSEAVAPPRRPRRDGDGAGLGQARGSRVGQARRGSGEGPRASRQKAARCGITRPPRPRPKERRPPAMNPSEIFILRPVATTLLMVAILLAGMFAYNFLPLSALPEVDYPTIQVQTFYPGASPEVMTSAVTAPLERQFGQMPGLNQMTSASSGGASVITLQFNLDLSLDIAEQEVQAAINAGGNLLPQDLPAPPVYAKVNPADAPIMTLAVASKSLPLIEIEDLVETRLAQKLSQQPGVGLVSISGGQRPAVRIQFNPGALAAYGLNIDDLRTTSTTTTPTRPRAPSTARNNPRRSTPTIRSTTRRSSATSLSPIAMAIPSASATWRACGMDRKTARSRHGPIRRARSFSTSSASRAPMSFRSVDTIKTLLPKLRASLPVALDVTVLSDRTTTIRASVEDVEFELGLAVVLVVLVIFVFLRNLPATIIPSLSVPLSLVGTLVVMYLLKFSLDNLSLMALTISTGFVVDDAIVMIENISRYIEEGEAPLAGRAARLAADRLHHHFADSVADRGADPAAVHGRCRRPSFP